ncbi:MAG: DUF421 domain-containing protein [Clostridia bacterium]|nr:DUF421 domain-containing protein [Clostridia bacterium]
MLVIFLRTFIIFLTLVVVMRLMGKRQIGEMQPFEFIVTLIIADLACIPMADVSIPLIYGLIAIIGLFLLHQLLSVFEMSSNIFKRIISGKPSIVINPDGVNMKELKQNNLGVGDLIEAMRAQGYFSLDDLRYAIFESNGKLSALENEQTNKGTSVPLLIIDNGKINSNNLKAIKEEELSLVNYLNTQGSKVKNIEVMTLDGNGRVYLKIKNQKYKILQFNLQEGVKW